MHAFLLLKDGVEEGSAQLLQMQFVQFREDLAFGQ